MAVGCVRVTVLCISTHAHDRPARNRCKYPLPFPCVAWPLPPKPSCRKRPPTASLVDKHHFNIRLTTSTVATSYLIMLFVVFKKSCTAAAAPHGNSKYAKMDLFRCSFMYNHSHAHAFGINHAQPQRLPPPSGIAFAPDTPANPPPYPPPPKPPRPPRPPPPPPPPPIVIAYCCSCDGTCWLASRRIPTSALDKRTLSMEKKLMALPEAPARPVRPMRCT